MAASSRARGSAPALALSAIIVGLCARSLAFIALLMGTRAFIHQFFI